MLNREGYTLLVAFYPRLCRQDMDQLPVPDWTYRRRFYMIREKNKLVSPVMQNFMKGMAAKLSHEIRWNEKGRIFEESH
ncbi:hypothetical protein [Paenibacillus sp. NPDC057934]|uniref:hypothetical protein n=1 Tax=Paenibacillus sp. NPDC057934 TaxID=3346282 RepID=UPI0036D8E676